MKKYLGIFLLSTFISLPIFLLVFSNVYAVSGTAITTCTELQAMSNNLSGSYYLASDVNCSGFDPEGNGKGFIPVGTDLMPFTGNFDGNGHTISNLTINRDGTNYIGLFGNVAGGTFQNVTIAGSISGSQYVGALIGSVSAGTVVVSNVNSSVTTNSDIGYGVGSLVGAVISSVTSFSITNSHSSGNVTINSSTYACYSGGFMGYVDVNDATINNNSYSGNLSVSASDYVCEIGGLIGETYTGTDMSGNYVTGDITINSSGNVTYGVGGLIGYAADRALNINSSHYSGDITVNADGYIDLGIGGLVGYYYGGTIDSSYAEGNINITTSDYVDYGVGGLAGYVENDYAYFTNGHFRGNINIDAGGDVYEVGGIVGHTYNYGGSATNVYVVGNIDIDANAVDYGVGGILGYNEGDVFDITSSYYSGNITINSDNSVYDVGGLAGYYYYGGTINTSYARGNININSVNSINYIGGLIGGDSDEVYVNNSFSYLSMNLVSSNSFVYSVGGILGYTSGYPGFISSSYASGRFTLNSGDYIQDIGGLVGYADGLDAINSSFSAVSINATSGTDTITEVGSFLGYNAVSSLYNNHYDASLSGQYICTGTDDPDPSGCTGQSDTNFFKSSNSNHFSYATSATASSEYGATTWSASQATGAPDVNVCGDVDRAWAPVDSGDPEWLQVGFSSTSGVVGISIHETYNAPFIYKVELIDSNGTHHTVWESTDTTSCGSYLTVSFSERNYVVTGAKIYTQNAGYEEIDSVSLITSSDSTISLFTNWDFDSVWQANSRFYPTLRNTSFDLTGLVATVSNIILGNGPVMQNGFVFNPQNNSITPGFFNPTPKPQNQPVNLEPINFGNGKIIPEIPSNYVFDKLLVSGQTSKDVRYLQYFLRAQGKDIYPDGRATGYFGPLTKQAVIKFQEKYKDEILTPQGLKKGNGVVGPSTRKKINSLLGK